MESRYGTSNPPDRPEFELLVDGETLGPDVSRDVLEIDVDERVNRHGLAQILVRNFNPDDRSMLYSDGETFKLGAPLAIKLGYKSELDDVFSGIITSVSARFPADSIPVAIIEAKTRSVLLDATARPRTFNEQTVAEQIEAIADEYGLDAEVSVGPADGQGDKIESVFTNTTDWDRVLGTASRYGLVCYVRGSTIVARPPAAPEETPDEGQITLTYGTNIVDLTMDNDIANRADPIVAIAWDPEGQQQLTAEVPADDSGIETGDRKGLSAVLADSGLPNQGGTVTAAERVTQSELDAIATGRARRAELGAQRGKGLAIGVPRLRADQWFTLEGIGTRFSGQQYLSAVRHRLGSNGYNTEFTLGLPGPLAPRQAAHLPPARCGLGCSLLHLGVVVDLDDPQKWGRVKVRIAAGGGPDEESVWARLATIDAGPDAGTLFVPSKGDEVVAAFVGRDAIVLGSLWNGKSAPPHTVDPEKNEVRTITSRSGHQLRFSDEGSEFVELLSAKGHKVLLDDSNGAIELAESGGNRVVVDGGGITLTAKTGDIVLEAGAGTVKIDAVSIEGKSTGPSKLESSATLDVKASALLGLKGALVKIN